MPTIIRVPPEALHKLLGALPVDSEDILGDFINSTRTTWRELDTFDTVLKNPTDQREIVLERIAQNQFHQRYFTERHELALLYRGHASSVREITDIRGIYHDLCEAGPVWEKIPADITEGIYRLWKQFHKPGTLPQFQKKVLSDFSQGITLDVFAEELRGAYFTNSKTFNSHGRYEIVSLIVNGLRQEKPQNIRSLSIRALGVCSQLKWCRVLEKEAEFDTFFERCGTLLGEHHKLRNTHTAPEMRKILFKQMNTLFTTRFPYI